jgi:hypothetical protein
MAVDAGLGLRHRFVDFQMQEDLAGARLGSRNLISFEIDHAQVFGGQVVLAHQRGRADDLIGADAIGDVAAVAVNKLAHPELAPHRANLLLDGFGFRA